MICCLHSRCFRRLGLRSGPAGLSHNLGPMCSRLGYGQWGSISEKSETGNIHAACTCHCRYFERLQILPGDLFPRKHLCCSGQAAACFQLTSQQWQLRLQVFGSCEGAGTAAYIMPLDHQHSQSSINSFEFSNFILGIPFPHLQTSP